MPILKCYFGCVVDGPLHRYPKWDYPHTEKFDLWKSILSPATSARGNEYIYNNVRLCYRHFEEKFQLPSHRLTKNAVPTLNIFSLSHTEEQPSTSAVSVAYKEQPSTSTVSVEYEERFPATSGIDSLKLRHNIMAPNPKRTCLAIVRLNVKLQKLRGKCKSQSRKIRVAQKIATSKNFVKYIEKNYLMRHKLS